MAYGRFKPKLQDVAWQHHLQQASKVFHLNRWILQNKNVSIVKCLRHCEPVVSSMACFAGRHCTTSNRHLERLDTHFWKLCRSIVGPLPGTNWTLEWYEIFYHWNVRVNMFVDGANIKTWSHTIIFFLHSFIRLVYGVKWAGEANGAINPAAENKMRELSSAT